MFAQRRAELFKRLPPDSVVILFAHHEQIRNNDVHYPFRQESYFWYFTGFPEAEAVAVLSASSYRLYSLKRNPLREIWEGKIIGQEGAIEHYGVNEAFDLDALSELPKYLANFKRFYTLLGLNEANDNQVYGWLRTVHQMRGRGGAEVEGMLDLKQIAGEMRLIKSPEEMAFIERASQITALGQMAGMKIAKSASYEYEIQAEVEREFTRNGSPWSFPSIVASGANACCLHYRSNNAPLKQGDLLLLDTGAEHQLYAGDLTRTFPISGQFSKEQEALYSVVLNAQLEGIKNAKTGLRHLELHQIVSKALIQGLLDLKLITGSVASWLEDDRYKRFYPHGTGHWLGLDVHDVGVYQPRGESRKYQENMVITIEPGLYIQPDDTLFPENWRGIGIRIEDDVCITATGGRVLGGQVPKEVREIERLMND